MDSEDGTGSRRPDKRLGDVGIVTPPNPFKKSQVTIITCFLLPFLVKLTANLKSKPRLFQAGL